MSDLETLQGRWYVNSLEVDGETLSPECFAGAEIVLTGNRFKSLSMGAVYKGTIELERSANKPKILKLLFTDGPEKGNVNRGIYELKKDRWRLCLNMTGGQAPSAFATAPKSGHALETLTRTAPVVPGAEPIGKIPRTGGETPELEGEWAMFTCIRDGEPLDERMRKTGRRTCAGNHTRVMFGKQIFIDARFRVDRAAVPKTIDYVLMSGPNKGKSQLGIYEIQGAQLTLCFASSGQPRPRDFKAAPGDGKTLTTWRKIE
ncbi:MAG: TIGR03067 domain-containing protein [Acidobacteria bacterium]|nr:TIGR03067 domain-containing protein [Acidobacteriota bacterium]